jgi:hypothetical protein
MSKLTYTKEYVSDGNKFYWDEDTLNAFRFESNYMSKEELLKSVTEFVEMNCYLEDGETEEMLVEDLLNQIYNTNTTT